MTFVLVVWALAVTFYAIFLTIRLNSAMAFGEIVVTRTENGIIFRLELDGDPNEIEHRRFVVFKVVKDEEQESQPKQGL